MQDPDTDKGEGRRSCALLVSMCFSSVSGHIISHFVAILRRAVLGAALTWKKHCEVENGDRPRRNVAPMSVGKIPRLCGPPLSLETWIRIPCPQNSFRY